MDHEPEGTAAAAGDHAATMHRSPGRSLPFTVPLAAGERVAVVGIRPAVVEGARLLGAATVSVLPAELPAPAGLGEVVRAGDDDWLPLADAEVDHAIVPELGVPLATAAVDLARIVRPGGHVFIGALSKWRAWSDPLSVRPAAGQELLRAAGFADVRAYAIRYLARPRHYVPLDSPGAIRWYLRAAFPAEGRRDAITARLARLLPVRHSIAFALPAVGLVARRRSPP